MNHYETLGISNTATPEEIKKAYRKLASIHHPDKGGDTEQFKNVQVANETVSDPEKRAQYDIELAGGNRNNREFRWSGAGGSPFGAADAMHDFMRQQFGFYPGGQPQQRKPKNKDVSLVMSIPLNETLSDQEKTINIHASNNSINKEIQIRIPRGVENGDTLRFEGLGDDTIKTEPKGDLYIRFIIQPVQNYQQNGLDLYTPLTVNCIEAMIGSQREITGIDGSVFNLTIPPGTQQGAKFGIPDQGVFSTRQPGRGKLVVYIDVYIPKNLTEEQKQILRNMDVCL